ncbi:MAG TPA: TlpA disulfide reductase family protein, partial [Pyrinomonadaceae bacterium]|nr:TlpA disulfide reductase family protein [Pyrinomonadaceae bacterium]
MVIRVFLLLCLTLEALTIVHAQVTVVLRREQTADGLPGTVLLCDKSYSCGLASAQQSKTSPDDKDVLVKISRAGKDFNVLFDSNQNGSLADERTVLLRSAGSVRIGIRKRVSAKRFESLPFEIVHNPPDAEEKDVDQFLLRPAYVAAGTLTYAKCKSRIALLDMDFDGKVTSADASRGTNFRIDRNNDGKYWGKEEHKKTDEIVEFCGQNFLVTALSNRALVLTATNLQLAKVNELVPDFSFSLLNGRVINSAGLKGKPYVLDFWASWCVPCVKNLPQIKSVEEHDSIAVFSLNVDKPAERGKAQKIIEDVGIRDFSAVRGMGNADHLWKTFGGANSNRLAIPLYVLIDKNSVIRYA